jgi:hypothetical protein
MVNLADGFPVTAAGTNAALGYVTDAVVVGTDLELTTGWSLTAGYEHRWNPQWKTSLYGTYSEFNYSDAASAVIAGTLGGGALTGSADWSMWQIGSRTVWTPVANLDLSVDVLYTKINGGFTGTDADLGTPDDKDIFSAIFRAQRNFWP